MREGKYHFTFEVVGSREDELLCNECGGYGPIVIVKFTSDMRDLCGKCAQKLVRLSRPVAA